MRGVRQHEQSLGKRRPTGRPLPRTRSSEGASDIISRGEFRSRERTPQSHSAALSRVRSQPTPPPSSQLCPSPKIEFLDPFATMPAGRLSHATIDSVIQYSISHFMPLSFPTENTAAERESRFALLLYVKEHSPAAFLGFMTTVAAHRAVLYRKHEDLSPSDRVHSDLIRDNEYRMVLQEAVRATREMQKKGEMDGEFLEACFGLISAQTIVGDFNQSLPLLQFVNQALQTVKIPIGAEAWLPLVDIKTAMGLLSRPIKQLPWTKAPVPADVLLRIRPPETSVYCRLGVAFTEATHITRQLRKLLADGVVICQFSNFNCSNQDGLATYEHVMYRCKTHELEFDILSYVYDVFPCSGAEPPTIIVPALEQIIRMAILGILSTIAAAVHPAVGLGRALTYHQKNAFHGYGARLKPDMDRAELKILVWALFVYSAGARDQVEEPEFEYFLSQACIWLGLRTWEEVEEAVLYKCLYVPGVQGRVWREVWQRAEHEKNRWSGRQTLAIR